MNTKVVPKVQIMNDLPNPSGMNPQASSSTMNWSIEQERLIQILDKEIDLIQKAEQKPGWTLWAILAALGAVLWLLLDQLDSSSLTIENIPILFLSFSLFLEGIGLTYSSISYGKSALGKRLRFKWSSHYGEDRPLLLFELIRCGLLAYLAVTIPGNVGRPAFLISFLYFALGTVTMFLAMILSFLRFPCQKVTALAKAT